MTGLSFPSPSLDGLEWLKNGKIHMRLPSGTSPGEAKVGVLEIGPLHNFLGKGLSKPRWAEKVLNDV